MRGRPFSLCHSPSEVPMDCRLAASAGGQNRQQAHPGPAASLTSFGSSFNHLQVSKQLTQVANTVSPGCLGDSFSHLEIKPPVMTEAAQCPTCVVPPASVKQRFHRKQVCSTYSNCNLDQCDESTRCRCKAPEHHSKPLHFQPAARQPAQPRDTQHNPGILQVRVQNPGKHVTFYAN